MVSGRCLAVGLLVGFVFGVVVVFLYCEHGEQRALAEAELRGEEVRRELRGSVDELVRLNGEQGEIIERLSGTMGRVSLVLGEEVVTVQEALGVIARLRVLVGGLP